MKRETISNITGNYGIRVDELNDAIDSSRGEDDIRLTYIINQKHVLHCVSSKAVTEEFLQDISRLIQRHLSIGVYAPELYPIKNSSHYLCKAEEEGITYNCYMEELAPYPFLNEEEAGFYQAKENVLPFLGKLASRYANVDLSSTYSMWSIIDLAAFDEEIDEKQENINLLCDTLQDKELAERIHVLNDTARNHIKAQFDKLPRCVFQGDLNFSNILADENNQFKGLIDFNMFGTEVNVNCFLNESMYYMEESDFISYDTKELVEKIESTQNHLMSKILEFYSLNDVERAVYKDYQFVIMIGFYPNVMLMIEMLKRKENRKVIEFLNLICDRYEEYVLNFCGL